MNINGSFNKEKGMQTQVYDDGKYFFNSLFTLKIYPSPMLHNVSIYSPPMGNGGSNRSVSRRMEAQGSSYSLLDKEKNCFVFYHKTLFPWVIMV